MEEDSPSTNTQGADEGMATPCEKNPITIVEGKYRIFNSEVMGCGALSTVKKCEPIYPYVPPVTSPRMKFVVKEIEKAFLISIACGDVERATAQVKREVQILQSIPPHENIATFVEYVETPTHHLLFFEEVKCGDLCEILLRTESRKLPETKAKRYAYQIINAVLHCHLHDVCHRDIKPENLLLSEDDNLKLTDFGLAKYVKGVCTERTDEGNDRPRRSELTLPYPEYDRLYGKEMLCSEVVGTPQYGAPEMFYAKLTEKYYDGFKADTWAVGVVTFILLAGSFPFRTNTQGGDKEKFESIMDHSIPFLKFFSPLATDFIEQLLTKDPAERVSLSLMIDHPWLAEVAEPRKGLTSSLIRRHLSERRDRPVSKDDLLLYCEKFDGEVKEYQDLIGQLRWKITLLLKERARREKKSSFHIEETPPKRGGVTSVGRSSLSTSSVPVRTRATTPRPTSTLSSSYLTVKRATTPGPPSLNSRIYNSSPGRVSGMTSTPVRPGSFSTSSRNITPNGRASVREGSTVRRETPMKAPMMGSRGMSTSSFHGVSPSRGPSFGSSGTNTVGSSLFRPSHLVATTPRGSTPSRRVGTTRDTTHSAITSSSGVGTPRPSRAVASAPSSMAAPRLGGSRGTLPKDLSIGEEVLYKGYRAIVRFNGSTNFGTGTWIGLEMLEGEGLNDGYSFVDKKTYFLCPKGKGIFARAFQLTKIK